MCKLTIWISWWSQAWLKVIEVYCIWMNLKGYVNCKAFVLEKKHVINNPFQVASFDTFEVNKTESKFSPRPRANPFCNLFKSIQLLPVLSNFINNQFLWQSLWNTKMFLLDRKIWNNTIKMYSGHYSKTYLSQELCFCPANHIFPSAIMVLEMYKIHFNSGNSIFINSRISFHWIKYILIQEIQLS